MVRNHLGQNPLSGQGFVFINRRLKVLRWDGTGVWLSQRRLHRGRFSWPRADTPVWELCAEQWQWLVAGVQWQRLSAPAPAHWRV